MKTTTVEDTRIPRTSVQPVYVNQPPVYVAQQSYQTFETKKIVLEPRTTHIYADTLHIQHLI